MLLSLTFSLEIVASNNQVTSRSSGFTSINGKGVATFVVKSPVAQSCDLSFLMMPGEYEDGSFTSVTLKVNGVTLPNPITLNTYGWQPANTIGNVVTLNEGDNTVQFISGREDVPMVRNIRIYNDTCSKRIITDNSINNIYSNIECSLQSERSFSDTLIIGSLRDPIKYGVSLSQPYTYTTYIPLSISDTTVLTLYAPSENDPMFGFYHSNVEFNAYLFKFHENDSISYSESIQTHNKSFYWQDSIPPGNYYILLEALNETGYVTLRVNSIMYKCYAGGVSADFSLQPVYERLIKGFSYNMFTTNLKSRNPYICPNPILWLKKKVSDNKYVVIAFNNDNNTPTNHNWGLNARINYFIKDSILELYPDYSILLSSYNPEILHNEEYCDLYYGNLRNTEHMYKNMKNEDFIRSDGGIDYDNSYNCFAWSAGTNTTQLGLIGRNAGNILWFDSLYNNEVVCTEDGYFQRDRNSIRYTREGATLENAVVALWAKGRDDSFVITHAAIKSNPYDTISHGYAWESKESMHYRFFHPLTGINDTDSFSYYGYLYELYRPVEEDLRNKNVINNLRQNASEKEPFFEKVDILDHDLEIIANVISDIPLTQINKFELCYEKFKYYVEKQYYISSIWDLKDSDQYRDLLLCMQEINNGEYLAFDKFTKGDIFAMLLIKDYATVTPIAKEEWNKIFYNKDILHIKRTQQSKVNLFIKNLLSVKNIDLKTNNTSSGLNESFNVIISSNYINIKFNIEETSIYKIDIIDLKTNSVQVAIPETKVQKGEYEQTINLSNGNYIVAYYLNGNIHAKKIQIK